MKVLRDMNEWRALRATLVDSLGFVPTMGALHAGHASLLDASLRDNTITALSIYVNPTQFNNPEDLANYPDTLAADLKLAESRGVDFVLLPTYEQLYSDDYRFGVVERVGSDSLEGAHRPGHFDGVLTVVLKLLCLTQARRAYFGEKDFEQYELVRDMADAFLLPTAIVPCPTVREKDGLAMSSRNLRLTEQDRALAPAFPKALASSKSDEAVIEELSSLGFRVDYVVTRDGRRFGAAALGTGAQEVRLIDNLALTPLPDLAKAS